MAEKRKRRTRGKKRGAKLKLNRKLIEEVFNLLKSGNYASTVAEYVNVSTATWYRWLEAGEQQEKAGEQGIYREFKEAVKKAEAHAEIRNVQIIQKASETQWQASAWYLERKFNDKWGRKEKQEVEHSGKVDSSVDMSGLSELELKKLVESLESETKN